MYARARARVRGSVAATVRCVAARKFRLQTRPQVTDPLAVVSDGNGRATERPVHPSGASFGPSPAIISAVTYAHVVHVLAIYRPRPGLSPSLPRSFSVGSPDPSRVTRKICLVYEESGARARDAPRATTRQFVCASRARVRAEGGLPPFPSFRFDANDFSSLPAFVLTSRGVDGSTKLRGDSSKLFPETFVARVSRFASVQTNLQTGNCYSLVNSRSRRSLERNCQSPMEKRSVRFDYMGGAPLVSLPASRRTNRRFGPTERRTDGRTDGGADRQTDGR